MLKLKRLVNYFSKGEILLWGSSVGIIIVSFFLFDGENYLTLMASLVGVTSLIFNHSLQDLLPYRLTLR